jgi:AraC-like DNA-binding protein/Tfp pilus assembly protein PilF
MQDENHSDEYNYKLSSNEKFLRKLEETISSNLEDELFGVSELAVKLELSRMQVYRKVSKLTGKNVSQYIREKRLIYAHDLLVREAGTVSEISYRVGFGSPAYFNKCFREYYGYSPGKAKENEIYKTNLDPDQPDQKKKNKIRKIISVPVFLILIIATILIVFFISRENTKHKSLLAGNPLELKKKAEASVRDQMAIEFCQIARHHYLTFWNTADTSLLVKAHQLYDRVLENNPNHLDALEGKGAAYMAESKFDSALIYAEKTLFLDKNNQKAYGLKGECFSQMNEFDLAIENYKTAISLPPKLGAWHWYNLALARVYVCKNEPVKAMVYVNQTLQEDSQGEEALFSCAQIFYDLGEYDRALRYLENILKRSQPFYQPLNKFEILLMEGKSADAKEFIKSLCRNSNSKIFCDYSTIVYHHYSEDYRKVLSGCKNFGMNIFKFQITLYEISALWRLGFRKDALAVLDKLAIKDKLQNIKYRSTYYLIAGAYATVGDKSKAMEIIREKYNYVFNKRHKIILSDPFFENLRNDSEFLALVRQAQEEKKVFRAEVRAMEEKGEISLPL